VSLDGGVFVLLCRCLGRETSPEPLCALDRELASGKVDWVCLAALANRYLVTPALYESLRRKELLDSLPDDFRLYLGEVHSRNGARNAAIRRQAEEAIAALNVAAVVPLVLKGGASMFEDASGDSASLVGDLDLLVRRSDYARSEAVLRDLGYEAADDRSHARDFVRPHDLAAIDLHRDVGRQRLLVSADDAWRAAAPLPLGPLHALALCPTHRVLLGVFHSQVHERNHLLGEIPLRRLHDFAVTVERHGAAIDWGAVEARMRALGLGHVLQVWLHLADRLLGTPVPQPAATWRTRLHLRRCLLQLRHRRLALVVYTASKATERFARVHIDYASDARKPFRRNAHRLRRGWRLLRRYRWGLWRRVRDVVMRAIHEARP
jgi:hypothetical protein